MIQYILMLTWLVLGVNTRPGCLQKTSKTPKNMATCCPNNRKGVQEATKKLRRIKKRPKTGQEAAMRLPGSALEPSDAQEPPKSVQEPPQNRPNLYSNLDCGSCSRRVGTYLWQNFEKCWNILQMTICLYRWGNCAFPNRHPHNPLASPQAR